LPGK